MRPLKLQTQRSLLKDNKATSPAISTVILTGTTIVVILVAMFYASGYLNKRMAENEFSANKQFMLTTGLQIDDIAWTVGRTQTIRYTTTYGNIQFQSLALNYTFEVYDGSLWRLISANETGMILFNMPVSMYSAGNSYFERLSSDNAAFIQSGPSAPVASVYCIEKLPMRDGNYTRIVAVPSIRMLNSSITGSGGSTSYYKFFLPTLVRASASPYLSQSVSLTGTDIEKVIVSNVNQIRVNVTFPNGAPVSNNGFDSDFFKFSNTVDFYHASQTVALPSNAVVELYIGKITVGLGVA